MTTWFTGRRILTARLAEGGLATDDFLRELAADRIQRVRGTAVFMTRQQDGIPTALLHNIKHNKVVHERVVLLSVVRRGDLAPLATRSASSGRSSATACTGSSSASDSWKIPTSRKLLGEHPRPGVVQPDGARATSSAARRSSRATDPGMAIWREHLFAWMTRNASSASQFFSLPPNQVIELGAQVRM